MDSREYKCAICGTVMAGARQITTHILKKHSMESKAYYDRFIKGPTDGVCAICGKPTSFRSLSDGYKETCSPACRGKMFKLHPERVQARNEKLKKTNLERYGVENPFQSDEIKRKIAETNLERLGVAHPSQSADVIEKKRANNLEKYGATSYLHSEEGRKAVARTNLEKYGNAEYFASEAGKQAVRDGMQREYGVNSPSQSPELRSKMMETSRRNNGGLLYLQTDEFKQRSEATQKEKYGDWFSASGAGRAKINEATEAKYGAAEYFASEDFREKARNTNLEKYGVENYAQTDEYHEKVAATNLERYGAESYMGSPYYRSIIMKKYTDTMKDAGCIVTGFESKSSITYRCSKCGSDSTENSLFIMWRIAHGYTPCTTCLPKSDEVSLEEASLGEFLHSLGLNYGHYDHGFLGSQYGADMVFEDRKVVIEYDGLHWHSELFREPGYHLMKTVMAEEAGYHMIHIFSDEWMYKRPIVESRLRNLLAPGSMATVYARNCEVRDVPKKDSNEFLDANHIQGSCMDSTRLGLYSEGVLVALMTFGPNRFGDGHELIRYCNRLDTRVVGGAGKLFKHYVDSHPEVSVMTTYADRRWTSGAGAFYGKLGFEFAGESDPGYFYVNGDIRENRIKYQKHKLVESGADASLSEHEIMLSRGIYRIYDCGNLRYRWIRS